MINREELRAALANVFHAADAHESVSLELHAVRRERDKWRELAEKLGASGTFTYDTTRQHFKLTTLIDAQLLRTAVSTRQIVARTTEQMYREARAYFEAKGLWK